MSKDQQPRNPDSRPGTSTSSRQETRRRILRAAAGAPVVFTLPSGTALAATSLWCLENSMERASREAFPATVMHEQPNPGDWVRVAVPKLRFQKGGSENIIEGYMIDYTWHQVAGEAVVDPESAPWQSRNPTGEYYYLLVDYSSGNPIPHGSSQGTPIHGTSCWTSLAGLGFPSATIN